MYVFVCQISTIEVALLFGKIIFVIPNQLCGTINKLIVLLTLSYKLCTMHDSSFHASLLSLLSGLAMGLTGLYIWK